jgi:nicotinate-nucleotide pyrophosphorylase (carboxylating)
MDLTAAELASVRPLLRLALAEDLGASGDRTSLATIPASKAATAAFTARRAGVIAGLAIARMVCGAYDPALRFTAPVTDGTAVEPGAVLAEVTGSLRSILAAERTALNFLQRLSGIATLTRQYVDAVAGLPVQVLDTRKTTPGWRLLEKYAVRMGDDPHPVRRSVELARAFPGNEGLAVEVEVDSIAQLEEVLSAKPEIVLLDNMTDSQLRECVSLRNRMAPETKLEASGGVNLSTVRSIAETGVDRISVGALTHSAHAFDIGLDFVGP